MEEEPEKPPPWGGPTLADENELRQFLKVIRPDWSQPRARGTQSNIKRVMKKLEKIGVRSKEELMTRTMNNKINEDLNNAGFTRFGRETVDNIKKQAGFHKLMENLTDTSVRQHGRFAPVPHLLSKKTRYGKAAGGSGQPRGGNTSPREDASLPATLDRDDFLLDSERSHYDTSNFEQMDDDWGGNGGLGDSLHTESFGETRRLRQGSRTYTPMSASSRSWMQSKMSQSNSLPSLSRSQTDWTPRAARERSVGALGTCGPASQLEELAAHIQALQSASSRGGETYDRLASRGEEALEGLDQEEAFRDQGGSSVQMVQITASYAKLGVNPKRVLALLMDDRRTVGELRQELDMLAACKMQQVGEQMGGRSKMPPRWRTDAGDHSRTLLLEAAALDEKARLDKMMRMEGTVSPLEVHNTPLRRHIARNLRSRMKEEQLRAGSTSMEVSQKFMNIKRQLTMMANSKRELGSLQKKMLELNHEERVPATTNQYSSMAFGDKPTSGGLGEVTQRPPTGASPGVTLEDSLGAENEDKLAAA